jgi:hypothetical protein
MGGYSADVLFENLELMRTVRAAGGRVASPLDLYVMRRPPTSRRFWSQRVRQAYDEFARPWRLVASLMVMPAAIVSLGRRRARPLVAGALATIGLAEFGRRRAGGTAVFPLTASLLAPLWVLERALCSWIALAERITGGCRYGGTRVRLAATPVRRLEARFEARVA